MAQRFLREIPLVKTASVIDVRCRSGWLTRHIARIVTAGKVVGVDSSERRIRRAIRRCVRFPNVEFYVGNAEILPWETGSFDCVICLDSFHECPNPRTALTEMRRILKPGGKLFLGVPECKRERRTRRSWALFANRATDLPIPEQYLRYFQHSGFLDIWQKMDAEYVLTVGVKT